LEERGGDSYMGVGIRAYRVYSKVERKGAERIRRLCRGGDYRVQKTGNPTREREPRCALKLRRSLREGKSGRSSRTREKTGMIRGKAFRVRKGGKKHPLGCQSLKRPGVNRSKKKERIVRQSRDVDS